jgi:glycosyltransferase involved in cell wall biosynthesis
MEEYLVTIGLPCYNAESTIARAIFGALAQNWPNIELIIVDDVSSDGSVAAIELAIVGDARARLVRHKLNTGPAGARNTVLDAAKGEFIAFFDDDDESLPERISMQIQKILAYENKTGVDLVACYGAGVRLYQSGYTMPLMAIGSSGKEVPNGPAVADYLLFNRRRPDWFYGGGTPACSLMARRNTFVLVGGFDSGLRRVEDADFAIRLALMSGHFIGTIEPLYNQYSTEAVDKSPERNLEAEQCLAEKHRSYLDSIGRYQYALRWPKLRYWHFKRNYLRFLAELLGLIIRYPLAIPAHLIRTGPRRLLHERRISKG